MTKKISIIIPVYSNLTELKFCLDSVLKQDYKERFEIVLVNVGFANKKFKNFFFAFSQENLDKADVKYVYIKQESFSHARNAGVQNATGDFIFFTRSNCTVPENWVSKILEAFEKYPKASIVGGRCDYLQRDKYTLAATRTNYIHFDGYLNHEFISDLDFQTNPIGDTRNICYKREVFEEISLFDTRTRDMSVVDWEFKIRSHYYGLTSVYLPLAVTCQEVTNLKKFISEAFYQGKSDLYIASRFNYHGRVINISGLFYQLSFLKNKFPRQNLSLEFLLLLMRLFGSKINKVKPTLIYKKKYGDITSHERENVVTKLKEFCVYLSGDFYHNSNEAIERRFKSVEMLSKEYEKPLITIIIPFYNRPEYVTDFFIENLNGLVCSDSAVELIFVDDGSIDETLLVLQESVSKFRFKTRVLTQPNGGPSSARNLGIRNAQGEYIFMTDSDVSVSKYWLREFLAGFLYNPEIVLVGGGQIHRNPITIFDKWRNTVTEKRKNFFMTNTDFVEKSLPYDTANMAIKNGQNLFFDENYKLPGCEDFDFVYHIKKRNKVVAYIPFFVSNLRHMDKKDYEKMVHARAVGHKFFVRKTKDSKHFPNTYHIFATIFGGKFSMYKLLNLKNLVAKLID